jgi:hypothetical protein
MSAAVSGMGDCLQRLLTEEEIQAPDRFGTLAKIVGDDATRAGAVIEVVRAQTFASSQLVDNLNASTHLRALLTDLFVVDELLGLGVDQSSSAQAPGPA